MGEIYPRLSSVYGPVGSWRLGSSLGIDMLLMDSICSFRCVYCQLGKINTHTSERKVYVPTERVVNDLRSSDWQKADVITFSGSGEPTLALNLGDAIEEIRKITGKPIVVLTNAAHLDDPAVCSDLGKADKVFCKLDAADEEAFERINKPVKGITLETIISGIERFRIEYTGYLAIQSMFRPLSGDRLKKFAVILKRLDPDEVQVNYPSRAIPQKWFVEARGNYDQTPYPAVEPKRVSRDGVLELQEKLSELTGLKIVSSFSDRSIS